MDGTDTWTLAGRNVRSNFGWADGSDADDGDSHRARFFQFTLLQDAQITLTAARQGGVVVNGTPAEGDFNPACSVYAGTFGLSYHEAWTTPTSSPTTPATRRRAPMTSTKPARPKARSGP